jgi:hypothetical protein
MTIDLRAEMDGILDGYGFPVLLQRSGKKIRCVCWSEKYQEADSTCLRCAGQGYVSRIERHQTRRMSAVQIISRPALSQQTPLGKMYVDAQTFYMRHDAHPKAGDMIYEVGWRGHKPTHLIQAYRINDVVSMRGEGGRIEYWSLACRGETMSRDLKQIVVRSIGPIKNYELIN